MPFTIRGGKDGRVDRGRADFTEADLDTEPGMLGLSMYDIEAGCGAIIMAAFDLDGESYGGGKEDVYRHISRVTSLRVGQTITVSQLGLESAYKEAVAVYELLGPSSGPCMYWTGGRGFHILVKDESLVFTWTAPAGARAREDIVRAMPPFDARATFEAWCISTGRDPEVSRVIRDFGVYRPGGLFDSGYQGHYTTGIQPSPVNVEGGYVDMTLAAQGRLNGQIDDWWHWVIGRQPEHCTPLPPRPPRPANSPLRPPPSHGAVLGAAQRVAPWFGAQSVGVLRNDEGFSVRGGKDGLRCIVRALRNGNAGYEEHSSAGTYLHVPSKHAEPITQRCFSAGCVEWCRGGTWPQVATGRLFWGHALAAADVDPDDHSLVTIGGENFLVHREAHTNTIRARDAHVLYTGAVLDPREAVDAGQWLVRQIGLAGRIYPRGLTYRPESASSGTLPGEYNRWHRPDYPIEPGADFPRIRQHVLEVLCDGDPASARYFWLWLCHMLCRTTQRSTTLCFSGGQGAGKSIMFDHFVRRLVGESNFHKVNSIEEMTAPFNRPLAETLVTYFNEAFFPGHRSAWGRIKAYITQNFITVNEKYRPAYTIPAYQRIISDSNDDWSAPAQDGDRRHAIFRVSDHRRGDSAYFAALLAEINDDAVMGRVRLYLTRGEMVEALDAFGNGENSRPPALLRNLSRQQGYTRENEPVDNFFWRLAEDGEVDDDEGWSVGFGDSRESPLDISARDLVRAVRHLATGTRAGGHFSFPAIRRRIEDRPYRGAIRFMRPWQGGVHRERYVRIASRDALREAMADMHAHGGTISSAFGADSD